MAREKKQHEPESSPGAPEWMVTFSDCMTLLLTFFVLLLSFSSFDDKIFRRYRVIFEKHFSFDKPGSVEDAFLVSEAIEIDDSITQGSEKPTLEKGSKDQHKKETESEDFHNRKVFLISSDQVFYGNGAIISLEGRRVLTDMAMFLKELPARVVVSENCSQDYGKSENLGMERAWAVIDYMSSKQKLDKKLFSISATGTVDKKYDETNAASNEQSLRARTKRTLEIVLLERGIYN
jgi:chemotaxis protein MotB